MFGTLITKSNKALKALVTRKVQIECDRIPYRFENLPLKKTLNWICVEASTVFKPQKPWGWPTHLQVEASSMCNLRCPLCPVTTGMDRPTGHMDFDLFQKVIDDVGDYVFLIILWGWGEPLLNPAIHDMICYARQKGIRVVTSTNGHPLARPGTADRLIQSGLDSLIVAVDGITQETYEQYRQGGCLDTVLEGVRTLFARRSELGSKTPLINLRFLVMKHNEHEVSDLPALAQSLGVDVLSLKTLNPADPGDSPADAESDDGTRFVPQNERYRRFRSGVEDQDRVHVNGNPCKNLWNSTAIHSGGNVCPCDFDCREKHILGDLSAESFKDIWKGAKYQRMRHQFRLGWESIDSCRNCSYAYQGGSCIDETVAEVHFLNDEYRPK